MSDPDVDRELREKGEGLIAALDEVLDIEAGLAEIIEGGQP